LRAGAELASSKRNTGTTPAKVIVTYVVEKGQPLAQPVKWPSEREQG
jgi:hypothetical protein